MATEKMDKKNPVQISFPIHPLLQMIVSTIMDNAVEEYTSRIGEMFAEENDGLTPRQKAEDITDKCLDGDDDRAIAAIEGMGGREAAVKVGEGCLTSEFMGHLFVGILVKITREGYDQTARSVYHSSKLFNAAKEQLEGTDWDWPDSDGEDPPDMGGMMDEMMRNILSKIDGDNAGKSNGGGPPPRNYLNN